MPPIVVVSIFGGGDLGEATNGYTFSALSTTAYGTLTTNTTTGQFTFDPPDGTDVTVEVIVTDSFGGMDNQTFNIEVTT